MAIWHKSRIWNGITNASNSYNKWNRSVADTFNDNRSYSDFVSKANEGTNGWYSTLAGAAPVLSGIHNAILGRDSSLDYLANTGLSWSDIPGYNASRLTGGSSAGISHVLGQIGKIEDGKHDLGEFYSGDRDLHNVFDSTNGIMKSLNRHDAPY